MKIRCSKCFKKYDDREGECPRCGTINDRKYDVQDVEEKATTKKARGKTCAYCGSQVKMFQQDCPLCGNSNFGKSSNTNPDRMTELACEAFESSGLLSTGQLDDTSMDFNEWQMSFNYKFGTRVGRGTVKWIGYFLLIVFILAVSSWDPVSILLLMIFIGAPCVLLINYFSENWFSEYINIYRDSLQNKINIVYMVPIQGRNYNREQYSADSNNLKHIEIVIGESIEGVRFIAKENSNIHMKDYYIDVKVFEDQDKFKAVMMLLSKRCKFPVYIVRKNEVKEEVISVEKQYVRLDKIIIEPDESVIREHDDFISFMKKHYDIIEGQLGDGRLTLIKSDDYDKMIREMNQDPLITNGYVKAEIMEWQIKVRDIELLTLVPNE